MRSSGSRSHSKAKHNKKESTNRKVKDDHSSNSKSKRRRPASNDIDEKN